MKNNRMSRSNSNLQNGRRMSRRTCLKLAALTGSAFAVNCLAVPFHADASSQESAQNGQKEEWVSTSCLNCTGRCAIRVQTVNGKAVRIVGNALSRVSDGKICPRAHIGLQVLYDRERLNAPCKRTNSEKGKDIDPGWTPISWNQALNEIAGHLRSMRASGHPEKLVLFQGLNPASNDDLLSRFAEAYGTPNLVSGKSLDNEAEKSGNWMADGHYDCSAYDLDHVDYILAFGADLLESAKPLSRFLRKWGKFRRERPNRAKVVVVNPRYSQTAACSDEWIPIQPGTDGALAMAIAYVIISENLYDESFVKQWTEGFEPYKKLVLSRYSPASVAGITGIPAESIERIAREFISAKPALAIRGKEALNRPEGSYTSLAIYCLNALAGSIDVPGGVIYQENPPYGEMPPVSRDEVSRKAAGAPSLDLRGTGSFPAAREVTNQIPESILGSKPYPVEMAIGFNSNFNLFAPGSKRWDEAMKKLPYYVHVAPFVSEMAVFADIVLPATTFLEEWGYDHSLPGAGFAEARIKQPVVKARGEARPTAEILFDLARRLPGAVANSFTGIGDGAKGFVRNRTSTLAGWDDFTKKGVWLGPNYEYRKYKKIFNTPSKKFEFRSGNLKALNGKEKKAEDEQAFLPHYTETTFLGEKDKYPLILLPYQPLMAFESGSQNYPWAQEIFLPMHGLGWTTLVEVNSATAAALGLKDGKEVWVESPFHKIKARVKFSEGVHPGVVAMASGQGHSSYGRWQKGLGANPNELLGVDYDRISGQAAFFNTRVRVYKA
jgi:thiosulfate reductase / polysulfide reductase chain A